MEENKKMAKATMLYFIGNILSKAIVFFLLPIYTKYIEPTDYGTYELTLTYINILMSLLYFDIWSTVLRFMYKEKNKYSAIYSGFIIFVISSVLYIIAFSVLNHFMHIPYIEYVYIYGIIVNLGNVYGRIARGFEKSMLFAVSGIVSTIVNVASNLILIVGLHVDYKALYISYILGILVQIIMIECSTKVIKHFDRKLLNKKLFKEMLFFSLPLCMNSIGYWILNGFNKIYISMTMGNYETGLYSVASKFSMILTTVADCFLLAWQELAFGKKGDNEEKEEFFTKMLNFYSVVCCVITVFIIIGVDIIYPYFIDQQYSEGAILVPISIIGTVFSIISSFLGSIYGSIMKNKSLFISTAMGAIANVVFAIVLSPQYGMMGVNIAMALGLVITAITRLVILNRYIKIKMKKTNIVICIGLLIFGYLMYNMNIIIQLLSIFAIITYISIKYRNEILQIIQEVKKKVAKV